MTTNWKRARMIAERIDRMLCERASKLGAIAGLGGQRNVWANAMMSFAQGSPWREVNYRALREAIHIDGRRQRAYDLEHAIWRRAMMKA